MAIREKLSDLQEEEKLLSEKLNLLNNQMSDIAHKKRDISNQLSKIKKRQLKSLEEDLIITEHAVLRYLIRVKGFDVESVINEMKNIFQPIVEKSHKITMDAEFGVNGEFVGLVRQGMVITVMEKAWRTKQEAEDEKDLSKFMNPHAAFHVKTFIRNDGVVFQDNSWVTVISTWHQLDKKYLNQEALLQKTKDFGWVISFKDEARFIPVMDFNCLKMGERQDFSVRRNINKVIKKINPPNSEEVTH